MRGLDPFVRWTRLAVAGCALLVVAGACAPAQEGDIALSVLALDQCSGGGAAPAPQKARIVIRGGGTGVPCQIAGQDTLCFEELGKVANWGESVSVGGVPEGSGWEVTVLGYAGSAAEDETPVYFARATDVRVRKGENSVADAILTRFGGLSCPAVEGGDFPQRVFASVTPTGDGRVVIAGGFTAVAGSGDDAKLVQPDGGVYIYEPLRGRLRKVAEMERPRAGHAAVFLDLGTKQWVVFMGGTDQLPFNPDRNGFPIDYDVDATKTAFSDFEALDLSTETMVDRICSVRDECTACCDTDGKDLPDRDSQCEVAGAGGGPVDCPDCCFDCNALNRSMVKGRVFARPAVMSDGFVIVTGGGDWPEHKDTEFRAADVFSAEGNCGFGGFQREAVLPRTESIRAGHSVAFLDANEAGRYRYLLWGGTKEDTSNIGGENPIGEIYVESSMQADEVSGVFRPIRLMRNLDENGDESSSVPKLYFHTLTPLTDRHFLLAGGVRSVDVDPDTEGVQPGLQAPSPDDLYVITLEGEDALEATVRKVRDGLLGTGRFLHSASSHDGRHVVLFGGASGYPTTALSEPLAFDAKDSAFKLLAGDAPFARLGHTAVVLPDDTLLLVGGLQTASDLDGSGPGALEVYTPPVLNPLWD